jgi:iron complex outermembrane receptor protein
MILKGTRYIGDELVGLPGIYVEKNDDGTYTSVTIRGVPQQHHNETFLAMVDGVPFVTGNEEIDLELIPTDIVERVEVVKGPMSALYGRGSVAGAINYISKRVPLDTTGLFGLNAGSYGTVRPFGSAGVALKPGKNHLFVSALGDRKGGWRDDTERGAGNFYVKDQWFINDRTDLIVFGNYHKSTQHIASHIPLREDGSLVGVAGGIEANHQIEDPRYKKDLWMVSGMLRQTARNNLAIRTTVHYRRSESDSRLGFNDGVDETRRVISWNGFHGDNESKVFFVEPQVTWTGSRARLVAGGSYERLSGQNIENWTGQTGFSFVDFNFYFYSQLRNYQTGQFTNQPSWVTDTLLDATYDANVGAGYGQFELDLGSRATIAVGARADYFDRTVDYGPLNTTLDGPTPGSTLSDSDHHVSPKISATVKLSPTVTAYGAYGEGFNPAFGPVWAFGDRDVNLKPEVARGYEGGVKGDVAAGRLSLAAAAYRLERRDLLQLILDGPGTRTTNAGKQHAQGIELDSRFSTRRGDRDTSGYARYAFTDSVWKNNSFVDSFTRETIVLSGNDVTGIPRHQFSLGATQRFPGNVAATVWYDYNGAYYIDGDNDHRAEGVGLLNATLTYSPTRLLDVQLTATNLTDKRYYYYYGTSAVPTEAYPGMPLQVLAGVRVRLN